MAQVDYYCLWVFNTGPPENSLASPVELLCSALYHSCWTIYWLVERGFPFHLSLCAHANEVSRYKSCTLSLLEPWNTFLSSQVTLLLFRKQYSTIICYWCDETIANFLLRELRWCAQKRSCDIDPRQTTISVYGDFNSVQIATVKKRCQYWISNMMWIPGVRPSV